jgi:hypothetical protein
MDEIDEEIKAIDDLARMMQAFSRPAPWEREQRRELARIEAETASTMPTMRPAVRRRQRKVTLASALKEAAKAGKRVAGAVVDQDGKVELRFGEPGATSAPSSNPWDEVLQ